MILLRLPDFRNVKGEHCIENKVAPLQILCTWEMKSKYRFSFPISTKPDFIKG